MMMSRRRVLVSGVGLVTPLGKTREDTWSRVLRGDTGVEPDWDCGLSQVYPVARAREATPEALKTVVSGNPRAQEPRFIALALLATQEALADAGLGQDDFERVQRNVAVVIGSGMGAATSEVPCVVTSLASGSARRVSPFFVPRLLPNMASGNVSIAYQLCGPVLSPATACASGGNGIVDACRLIERGDVDVAICGGTESALDPSAVAGFARLKALTTTNSSQASRPFDAKRNGFVMGEGAGILVLESEEHYEQRIARGGAHGSAYARICGCGMSGDGYHVTSPHPQGLGAEACMRRALKDAGVSADSISYINAHATSTPGGDVIEAQACARVFSQGKIAISSTKGATGHLLGAAGAVESAFAILACRDQVMPPTVHVQDLDPALEELRTLDLLRDCGEKAQIKYTMSNSFGFGGTNVSLVFERV